MKQEKLHLKNTINTLKNNIDEKENQINIEQKSIKDGFEYFKDNERHFDQKEIAEMKTQMELSDRMIDQHKKDIKFKTKQLKRPYFGRIDFDQNGNLNTYYIGLGHVQDNQEIYCYDWRAPMSSMYYDDQIGETFYEVNNEKFYGDITLKRQYKIENGQLQYFLETDQTVNDEILQTALSQNTSTHMKEIVATIQKEQNYLIRADEHRNFLVQGVAGSGKTSIALHRASYLLYKHRDDFKNNDILILSPSNLFSNYISEVLPELGEENVLEMTFSHIAKLELEKNLETREEIVDRICSSKNQELFDCIAYKSSFTYLEDLKSFLSDVYAKLFTPRDLNYNAYYSNNQTSPFSIKKEELSKLYYETYGKLDIKDRIEYIAEYFAERFGFNKNETNLVKERLKNILYRMFPITDIYTINELFLKRQDLIFDDIGKVSYDDIAGLLIIKDYVFGLSQKFKIKYVIIDEMQDFSPAHFYIFNKLWDCTKLILGDINQCIEKRLSENYLDSLSNMLNAKYIYLKKAYRSTRQITEFCNKIIGLKDITVMSRDGDEVCLTKTDDLKSAIKNIIEKHNQYEHTAIICQSYAEAKKLYNELKTSIDLHLITGQDNSFDERIIITTASTSKGIEFDHVIIPNVNAEQYSGALGKNMLYVASSRALHKLDILYSSTLSTLIENEN